jgi:hypothetical protein
MKGQRLMIRAGRRGMAFSREAVTRDSLGRSPRNSVFKQPRAESASHKHGRLSFIPRSPIEDVADHFFRAFSARSIITGFPRASP